MTRQYEGAIHSTAPIIATQTTFYNNKANQLGGTIYSTSPITVAQCDLAKPPHTCTHTHTYMLSTIILTNLYFTFCRVIL